MKNILFAMLLLITLQVPAQNLIEREKIINPDDNELIGYGISISQHENYLIIGNNTEKLDQNGKKSIENAGAAYIYEKDNEGKWQFHQKIVGTHRHYNMKFGESVSIHGNTAVVGAHLHSYDSDGGNFLGQAGAVYVFERSINGVWNQVQKIVPSDRGDSDDRFGYRIVLNENDMLIGAVHHDELANGGAVYAFKKDSEGVWQETQILTVSDTDRGDKFGSSIAMGGNYAVIGAIDEGTDLIPFAGAAYVFKKDTNGVWNEVDKIIASDRKEKDYFGYAVGIDNDYIIVSAISDTDEEPRECSSFCQGSAYVFKNDGNDNWGEIQKLIPLDRGEEVNFGNSVVLKEDTIIVGAHKNGYDEAGENSVWQSGAAYVFEKSENDIWQQTQKVIASDRSILDRFGTQVFIGNDEVYITAASHYSGAFYIFDMDNGLGLNKNSLEDSIKIHPNPTSGNINIDFKKTFNNIKVKLTNSLGQNLLVKQYESKQFINVDFVGPVGLYFITVITDTGETSVFKVIKSH
ncbi:T9SS type A sorting domain-containing protein [Tamlana crocina]|uniref:T9SS type A sorting domain-containing protein n=1 Tax=Tamlana crocina TaxID=393006 RepID=A0ABX1DEA2_9FLAO|nr:T9SS type A sorting domain-containing protein [Tamlana crocina]NJX16675.1 T9SS type A sorting domain-containing protein [Tamlana crocina]